MSGGCRAGLGGIIDGLPFMAGIRALPSNGVEAPPIPLDLLRHRVVHSGPALATEFGGDGKSVVGSLRMDGSHVYILPWLSMTCAGSTLVLAGGDNMPCPRAASCARGIWRRGAGPGRARKRTRPVGIDPG